jgi:hypothetical protein
MSSWGCVSGHWTKNPSPCVTPPGSTFTHPITLKVYEVGPGNTLGALLVNTTQTFTMPYRPSADLVNCPGGQWYQASTKTCFNGYAFPIKFDIPGAPSMPDKVIVTVAYNTTHYGAAPLGQATACFLAGNNCPYDSLNVSAQTNVPTIGSFLDVTSAYLHSTWNGAYCDNGVSGTGTLRLDKGCWSNFQPQIRLTTIPPDAYQVRYFSNLLTGDASVINITNTGESSTDVGIPGPQNGNICVNTYTYSPDEQMVSCCSCLVTPNGLASLSVVQDLTSNTLTPIVPTSVVVKLLVTAGGATGSTCNAGALASSPTTRFVSGLAAWGSTVHELPVTAGTPATTYGVTETPFTQSTLSAAELRRMSTLCGFIQANGSGYGICKSCRVGGLGAAKR